MQYRETFTEQAVREKRVLAYATGAEHSESVVLESSLGDDFEYTEVMTGHTVSGKKYVAGKLIAQIASTAEGGKVGRYGPYDTDATDGRGDSGGVAPSSLKVLKKDQVVTFGDVPWPEPYLDGTVDTSCSCDLNTHLWMDCQLRVCAWGPALRHDGPHNLRTGALAGSAVWAQQKECAKLRQDSRRLQRRVTPERRATREADGIMVPGLRLM